MFRPALLTAAAATLALGALGAAPAEASVLAPPKPIAQRGAPPGCTGADNPLVLVWKRTVSQDQGCAQAAPVVPAARRLYPNQDECAAGPVVLVGTRHGNQDECAAEPVVRVGRRIV